MPKTLWIRAESKKNEQRAPLSPDDCAELIRNGNEIIVEKSAQRAIPDQDYHDAGCRMVEAASWPQAPDEAIVLGLKELLEQDFDLKHTHVYFGHAFKGQAGWQGLLTRFVQGGGRLWDLENLTDENGRRLAAFGYWAGFVGAALGVEAWIGQQEGLSPGIGSVSPVSGKAELVGKIRTRLSTLGRAPQALVTGALGRCGTGACDLLGELEISPTRWDMAETASGGPFPEILQHDLFVNCVLASPSTPVFVPKDGPDLEHRRLSVISDVSCDPTSDYNPVPIYHHTTTFDEPSIVVGGKGNAIEVIAIDHLPSHLPLEASKDYSSQLIEALKTLDNDEQEIWKRAQAAFDDAVSRL